MKWKLSLVLVVGMAVLVCSSSLKAQFISTYFNVNSIAYSPDGMQIAVGGGDPLCSNDPANSLSYAIRILDVSSGELVRNLNGHICWVTQVSWSPDSTQLVSVSDDGTARVWDVSTGETINYFGGGLGIPLGGAVWSPDGQTIGSYVGTGAMIWNPITSAIIKSFDEPNDNSEVVNFSWKPDNRQIVLATSHETLSTGVVVDKIKIWNVISPDKFGQLLRKFDVDSVTALAWSPDGKYLVSAGSSGSIQIIDPDKGEILSTLSDNREGISSIVWSPDSTRFASGGADNMLRVWDVQTGEELAAFDYDGMFLRTLAWSPDGSHIAYSGSSPDPEHLVTIVDAPPTKVMSH